MRTTGTTLAVRLDSAGDVLLAGPALRALAAGSERLVLLTGPLGAGAARLLPGVDEVLVWRCPWIVADPDPVDSADLAALDPFDAVIAVEDDGSGPALRLEAEDDFALGALTQRTLAALWTEFLVGLLDREEGSVLVRVVELPR